MHVETTKPVEPRQPAATREPVAATQVVRTSRTAPSLSSMESPTIFGVLYRLAARAPQLTPAELQARLTVGIANHFGAAGCAFHPDTNGWASASAEPALELASLSRLDRARLETIEARLVKAAAQERRMRSVLDLEDGSRVDEFLHDRLGLLDIFAFPLQRGDQTFAVLVLYLGNESRHLGEADLHALASAGHLFDIAGTSLPPARS